MPSGRVKWFDSQKGFGFVTPDAGGADVFVHSSVLPEGVTRLEEGQPIDYEIEATPRGSKIVRVRLQ